MALHSCMSFFSDCFDISFTDDHEYVRFLFAVDTIAATILLASFVKLSLANYLWNFLHEGLYGVNRI